MNRWTRRRALAVVSVTALASTLGVSAYAMADDTVDAQVLAIADFHRQLQPPEPDSGGEVHGPDGEKITVGGAAHLAAHLSELRTDNSMTLASGDSVGGVPFESTIHMDEPTVEALETLGVDVTALGNHELDFGKDFLIDHLINGECYGETGKDSCFTQSDGQQFDGADFEFSSANVVDAGGDTPIVDPYYVTQVDGPDGEKIPVGVISATHEGTEEMPTSFNPELETTGIVESVNKYAQELTDQGVHAIVANVHEGAEAPEGHAFDDCQNVDGPLMDMAGEISPQVDGIIGGHLDSTFNCEVPDPDGNARPVMEGGDRGGLISEMNLAIDPETGDAVRDGTTARNHPVTRDIADPEMGELVDYWKDAGDERGALPVGETTGDFTKDKTAAGESTLGDMAADVNLWSANQDPETAADLGLVMTDAHQGSNTVLEDILVEDSGEPGDADGRVTTWEAWSSYGLGLSITTVSLTGADIEAAIEEQWTEDHFGPLAVSENVSYSFDEEAPIGERVDPADVEIDGEPLDVDKTYRVAGLPYTFLGMDGLPALENYTDPVRGQYDHEVILKYVEDRGTLTPAPLDRVSVE